MSATINDQGVVEYLPVQLALAAVLADLPAIAKNGQAPGNMGGYAFRKVEDITGALKPLFARHGILCLPSVSQRIESERPTKSGGVMFCVDLEICFRFVGPRGDELTACVWGQGTDAGDKSTQKAVTSAFKTMLSVVFCISDSEQDAEAHDVPETHRPQAPAPAPKERVDDIRRRVVDAGIGTWVKDQGFPWPWPEAACDAIEAAIERVERQIADEDQLPAAASSAGERKGHRAGNSAQDTAVGLAADIESSSMRGDSGAALPSPDENAEEVDTPPDGKSGKETGTVPAASSEDAPTGRALRGYDHRETETVELPPCAEDVSESATERSERVGNPSSGVQSLEDIKREVKDMSLLAAQEALDAAGLSRDGTPRQCRDRLIGYIISTRPF